jgi:2-polyprenyl-3-methyl-5-hydroxy-6-metoxy-1,4-benzoquinol methylase
MKNFRQRSEQKELMDGDDISFEAMSQTLKELNIINTRLGGHAITLDGFRKLNDTGQRIVVCEIGCGGGDNLFAIHKYCLKKNIKADFIGIDMNATCIAFAKQQYPHLPCRWICSDYAVLNFGVELPTIIFSSLFCHHFTNDQLITQLQWMIQNSQKGFFINDLHRHWLAYYLIKNITWFFSKSYLVKNDACVSVARSLTKKEWQLILDKADLKKYQIHWRWAFRWLIVSSKESPEQMKNQILVN